MLANASTFAKEKQVQYYLCITENTVPTGDMITSSKEDISINPGLINLY